ncbi:MAG: hypothetical protein WCJ64_00835 [Rhodospirillaceae bacterium]
MEMVKDWIIPIISLVLSIISIVVAIRFDASAKRSSEQAQRTLDQVTEAIRGWENEIMSAATNMLNSMPLIIEGKERLARSNATESALAALKDFLSVATDHNQRLATAEKITRIAESLIQTSAKIDHVTK